MGAIERLFLLSQKDMGECSCLLQWDCEKSPVDKCHRVRIVRRNETGVGDLGHSQKKKVFKGKKQGCSRIRIQSIKYYFYIVVCNDFCYKEPDPVHTILVDQNSCQLRLRWPSSGNLVLIDEMVVVPGAPTGILISDRCNGKQKDITHNAC